MWFTKLFHPVCTVCFLSRNKVPPLLNTVKFYRRAVTKLYSKRYFHCGEVHSKESPGGKSDIVTEDFFERIGSKSKETYLEMVRIYESRGPQRRGHVEFIYGALKHMEEFNVHKDLEVYKTLIDVFPKGKFIPTNMFQAEFMHYPKQQQCAIDVLQQMEDNGVIPDTELEDMLVNIFGRTGHPVRKYWRMMYWMPKFKNINPWPLPNPVPNDSLELATMALKQMSSVDLQSVVKTYQTDAVEHAIDHTWVVSAQSPVQAELIEAHPENSPIFVEGAFRIWLRDKSVNYFILRSDYVSTAGDDLITDCDDVSDLKTPFDESMSLTSLRVLPCVHEQEEGTILGMCATGTSSRDSLLSWIRILQESNPRLGSIPVLFSMRSPFGEVVPFDQVNRKEDSSEGSSLDSGKTKD